MLREAETQMVMVPRKYDSNEKEQAKQSKKSKQQDYLPKLVLETEAKKAFVY